MARGVGIPPVDSNTFEFGEDLNPVVFRSILKTRLITECQKRGRDFYYVDTGYLGNNPQPGNRLGHKIWHRVVKNDIQHGEEIVPRDADRLRRCFVEYRFRGPIRKQNNGANILVIAPSEKGAKAYGTTVEDWINSTVSLIEQNTDRPIEVRRKIKDRKQRIEESISAQISRAHCTICLNSNAAVESIIAGVPTMVTIEKHAAKPVSNRKWHQLDNAWFPDSDLIHSWLCHLSYCQVHQDEMEDGSWWSIITNES